MQVRTLLKLSIAAAVATITMKTAAWWVTDSVGLLSDAMESFVNLASALFAISMVTIAQRPADDDHPFGHTKAEYFSSGFEGLLIVGAAAGIIWAAAHRFSEPMPLQSLGWGLGLAVASSALNGMLAWRMMAASREHRSIVLEADARHLYTDVWTSAGVVVGLVLVHFTGWFWLDPVLAIGVALNILREGAHLAWRMMSASREHRSIVLEADARHLYTDVWTSAGVVVGLVLVHFTGWLWLDPVLAIGVALNILREGAHLAWRSIEGLMDSAVEPDVREQIDRTLAQFDHPTIRFDHLVTRRAGQRRFVDLHMHMPASWSLGRAAALRTTVEQALMSEVPGLRASIQLLPSDVEAHFNDVADTP